MDAKYHAEQRTIGLPPLTDYTTSEDIMPIKTTTTFDTSSLFLSPFSNAPYAGAYISVPTSNRTMVIITDVVLSAVYLIVITMTV